MGQLRTANKRHKRAIAALAKRQAPAPVPAPQGVAPVKAAV